MRAFSTSCLRASADLIFASRARVFSSRAVLAMPRSSRVWLRSASTCSSFLAAARDAHQQEPLGHDFGIQGVAYLKEFAALQQPGLQAIQAAHLTDVSAVGNKLDDAAAVDQQPLLRSEERCV